MRLAIAILVVALCAAIGAYLFLSIRPSMDASAQTQLRPSPATTTVPASQQAVTPASASSVVPATATSTVPSDAAQHPDMKLYRNDEYGFEFWYPETWRIELDTFGNPSSKFNLIAYEGNTPPDFNPLLVNVVTPEFVKGEYSANDEKISKVNISGAAGTLYEYDEETHHIDYVIPRGDIDIIISNANSDHISEFKKIVSSFVFTK